MDPLILLIGIGLLAIIALIVALASGGGGRQASSIEERLDQYSQQPGEQPDTQEIDAEAKRLSRLAERFDEVIKRRSFGARIADQLAQASIKLTVTEYLILTVVSIILFGALAFLVFRNFLFLTGLLIGLVLPRIIVRSMRSRRLRKFNDQLGDAINLMVNSLKAGYSVAIAMETVANDMPPPISEEFRRVVIETGLGVSLENALGNMLRRVHSPDLDLLITAINVQSEVGGTLADILETISETIRERVRIQGEIKTLTAQGEITGYVLGGLPFGLTVILFILNRDYMTRMFTTPCGWIMSGVAITIVIIGFIIMRKVVQIEI
jgi:tight adherence protein B